MLINEPQGGISLLNTQGQSESCPPVTMLTLLTNEEPREGQEVYLDRQQAVQRVARKGRSALLSLTHHSRVCKPSTAMVCLSVCLLAGVFKGIRMCHVSVLQSHLKPHSL